ncbi:MAG: hypothetical protein AAGG38_06760 [Planctomycetota bacterium]
MVKAVVWGGMLVAVFAGIFLGLQAINKDSGRLIGYAIGEADAQQKCQLQILIPLTAKIDSPVTTYKPNGKPDWDHWLNTHFIITDPSGQTVTLRQGKSKSADIDTMQAGTAEFIALGELDAGQTYTVDFIPVVGQPEKYSSAFVGQGKAFRRETFAANY